MTAFTYKDKYLHCEGVSLAALAEQFGTPLYVYSAANINANVARTKSAFEKLKPLIFFAVKANDNLTLLRLYHQLGLGFDVVSGGELHRVQQVGADPKGIAFAGAAKTNAELEKAVENQCGWICVESEDELRELQKIAANRNRPQKVLLRLNPDVVPDTHHHIVTGSAESKFGIAVESAKELMKQDWAPLNLCGVHLHIGSQIHDPKATLEALEVALNFLADWPPEWNTLDLGGGFPVAYRPDDHVADIDQFASLIIKRLDSFTRQLQIIIEPGRSLIADAASLLVSVQSVKQTGTHRTITVDGGMNALLRPALYDAYHQVLPVRKPGENAQLFSSHVAGPICESSDYLARERQLPVLERGDCLALLTVGAYGYSMASHYNAHPRPAEVLVDGDCFRLIRHRETYADLDRMDVE